MVYLRTIFRAVGNASRAQPSPSPGPKSTKPKIRNAHIGKQTKTLLNSASGPRAWLPGMVLGRFWPQGQCERTNNRSQTAREAWPVIGSFEFGLRPTPAQNRPWNPSPGTGSSIKHLNVSLVDLCMIFSSRSRGQRFKGNLRRKPAPNRPNLKYFRLPRGL